MIFFKKIFLSLTLLLLINTSNALEVEVLQQASSGINIPLVCTISSYDRESKRLLNSNIVKGFERCVSAGGIVGFQEGFIGLPENTNLFIELDNQPQFKFRVHNSDTNLNKILITQVGILEHSVVPLNFSNSERSDCDAANVGDVVECGGQVLVISPVSRGFATDLPGCIGKPNEKQSECRGGTFVEGDVIAMRLDYSRAFPSVVGVVSANGIPVTDLYPVRLATESNMLDAEPGHYSFIMAISEIPGDFTPDQPGCRALRGSTGFTISVTDKNSETALGNNAFITPEQVCPLTEGKTYYINAKPFGGTTDRCGIPRILASGQAVSNACRYEILTFFPTR